MSKVVLFSPVGGTDPISNSNCQDGALLHCCRVHKPDIIYMYMSQYALSCEREDHRYTYCLGKLYEKLGKPLDYKLIERPDLEEVHDFDFFYDDYKAEINSVMSTLDEDDTLLLNTSSGTPAMKSALVVLATLGDIDGQLLQVTTPDKKINKHDHDNYDVKMLWELNPDNADGFVDRCKVIECPSLLQLKNEELLKKLIRTNNYYAALEVAKMMPAKYTKDYIHLIQYAYSRITLDYRKVLQIEQEYAMPSLIPVREENKREIVEYALSTFTKASNGNYADFIRSITPLIVEIYVLMVIKLTKLNPYDFCDRDDKNGWVWSERKVRSNERSKEWIDFWEKGFGSSFKWGYIDSQSLLYIIVAKGMDTEVSIARSLRRVEVGARNIAAHQITAVTNESIKQATGKTCGEIVRAFKELFKYSGIGIPKETWNSYNDMNEYIIAKINHLD